MLQGTQAPGQTLGQAEQPPAAPGGGGGTPIARPLGLERGGRTACTY